MRFSERSCRHGLNFTFSGRRRPVATAAGVARVNMRSLLYLFVVAVAATPPARKQKRADKNTLKKYCYADANDSCDLLHNAVGGNCLKRLRKDPALCRRLRNATRNAVGYLEDAGAPPIEPILRPVVIGAGFGHTGTHAVAAYLDELGFNVAHNLPHVVVDAIRCRNFAKLDAFDAFLAVPNSFDPTSLCA